MPKLIRITTVPMALKYLLPGQSRYMKANGFEVLLISADGPERQEVIANEDCRHIIVPMTRKITPFKDLSCLWQLVKIFKKEKPDIVHTHTPKAGLLGMLAAKIAGVKIRIHTVAGMPLMVEKGAKLALLKNIEKLTYTAANNVWPNSFSLLKYIKEHRLTGDKKLKVISKGSSNGINLRRFNSNALDAGILQQVKDSIRFDTKHTYLLCIGRLVKDKGITELVDSFLALQPGSENLKLLLVGQFEEELDPLPARTMEIIRSNADIIHVGWSSFVEYYLSIASIFVFPSHREGFPNVLLQAGALKLPVICSSIPGNVDIVENKTTGLLFPVADVKALTDQLRFALGNRGQMKQMSEKLYQHITEFLNQENIWRAIHSEYLTLLNKNAKH